MATYAKSIAIIGVFIVNLFQVSVASVVSHGDYHKDFYEVKMNDRSHVDTSADGHSTSLRLDHDSAAGIASRYMYLFGQFDMDIKLVPGHSAGTVVEFYLTSEQPNRDQIDFKFLGNVSGEPYILQTNVYADGFANREERIYLWFDPAKDFHTYSVFWNLHQIVFLVDSVPIRVYKNHADKGVSFPRWQPMNLKAKIYDGSSWATRGGDDKVDWSKAPFIATFKDYKIDACIWNGNARFCRGDSEVNWWHKTRYNSMTSVQNRWLKWVRKHHMIYDYCQDNKRFHYNLPRECYLPKY